MALAQHRGTFASTIERLGHVRRIVDESGPITYEQIGKIVGRTPSSVSSYIWNLRLQGHSFEVCFLHLGANGVYSMSDLFKPSLIALNNNSFVYDSKNVQHTYRFFELIADGLFASYTKEKRASITHRFKNMLPHDVNLLVSEKLKRL
ncbi:MAG: hypothetical protein KGH71_01000 [Candidatus Micrarchaeota archaeon]|nr:hypothetical protein [Candidatus Micrarchaeota archaeon]